MIYVLIEGTALSAEFKFHRMMWSEQYADSNIEIVACNLAPNLFIKSRSIAIDYSDLIKYYDREAIDRVKAVLRTTL